MTLRDVYHCGIDKDLFARNIEQAQTYAADMGDEWISFAADDDLPHIADLDPSAFTRTRLTTPAGTVKLANTARFSPSARSARARSAGARHRIPRDERLASQQPVVTSSQ